jgi:hypothetical protein
MRIAERSDRVEPLLVGHDKQDIRAVRRHFHKRVAQQSCCLALYDSKPSLGADASASPWQGEDGGEGRRFLPARAMRFVRKQAFIYLRALFP